MICENIVTMMDEISGTDRNEMCLINDPGRAARQALLTTFGNSFRPAVDVVRVAEHFGIVPEVPGITADSSLHTRSGTVFTNSRTS